MKGKRNQILILNCRMAWLIVGDEDNAPQWAAEVGGHQPATMDMKLEC